MLSPTIEAPRLLAGVLGTGILGLLAIGGSAKADALQVTGHVEAPVERTRAQAVEAATICSVVSMEPERLHAVLETSGELRIEASAGRPYTLTVHSQGRRIRGTLPPPLALERIEPVVFPELARYLVRTRRVDGVSLPGIELSVPDSRWTRNYFLEGFTAVSSTHGETQLNLAPVEIDSLDRPGFLKTPGFETIRVHRIGRRIDVFLQEDQEEKVSSGVAPAAERTVAIQAQVKSQAGRPIAGAVLWSESDPSCFAISDADGKVGLRSSADQLASFWIGAPGFSPARLSVDPTRGRVTVTLEPADGAVTLTLVDSEGRPVRDAELRTESGRFGFSGPDGRIVMRGFQAFQPVDLSVTHPDFLPETWSWGAVPDEQIASINVRKTLHRPTTIVGTVVDALQRPLAGIEVAVLGDPTREPWLTSSDGSFALERLSSGGQAIRLTSPEGLQIVHLIETVPSGGKLDVGSIELKATSSLRGWLRDDTDEPIPDADVHIDVSTFRGAPVDLDGASRSPGVGKTAADGYFEIDGLPTGEAVRLGFSKTGFSSVSVGVVPGRTGEVEARLVKLQRVEILVTSVVDGGPIPGADVIFSHRRFPGADSPALVGRTGSGVTGPDGLLEIYLSARGAPVVNLSKPGYVDLEESPAPEQIEKGSITLSMDTATSLDGRVVTSTGEPLPGIHLTVDSGRPSMLQVPTGRTDEDGRFRITGIPVGESRIVLTGSEVVSQSRQVYVPAGGAEVEFQLSEGSQSILSGSAKWSDGAPATHLSLMITRMDTGMEWALPLDENGGFHIQGLPRGRYATSLRLPGRRVLVIQGHIVDLDRDVEDWIVVLKEDSES